ncbi:MAG: hypothetical protein CVU55_03510 [Deltaproteobacteria bacterium HGW-Deltaproteobacteria-13]|jgi:hypothetical protein|nr:MAG: hypothetical protein CVU55_03510 [Deltaproteobacteria bacterium HGW-Deltaproteobacteria-13]
MRKFLVLCLFMFSLSAFASDLPERIPLKSPTRSFTHEFEVSILEGRLWYRPKATPEAASPQWKLLGETGLPADSSWHLFGLGKFDSPASIAELSADGDNLIAIGSDSYVYYMKWGTRKWINKWGKPFSEKLRLPENIRDWSISHRGPFSGGYNDIDGNFHPISVIGHGVTTLYVLNEDGLNILYADPWLPADFSHRICGPLKNRFRARALAASASTIFVINDAGEMYTRLADYDTMGNNPFLDYSYERRVRNIPPEKDVRTLPPEEWKKQPSIPKHQGQITSAITILQTGRENDSRELRVEGVNTQRDHGFFSKPINGETWIFTQTDSPLQKPLLSIRDDVSDWGPNLDQTLTGSLRLGWLFETQEYNVKLKNFNPLCSGAALAVILGEEEAEFPFFTTTSSLTARKMEGAIVLADEIKVKATKNKVLQELINNMFGESSFIKIKVKIDKSGAVKVRSHSLFSLFGKVNMEFAGK